MLSIGAACWVCLHLLYVTGQEEGNEMSMTVVALNQSASEGETLQEEWVSTALLDVAYYLRSHKFNEYDRRFQSEKSAMQDFYSHFPDPPLRALHWEVEKYCSQGLIECLRYLVTVTAESVLRRSSDPVYAIIQNNWTFERPAEANKIVQMQTDCRLMFQLDWDSPEPFQGPIQRFQWRVSAAYYMCLYTMEGNPELSTFGEKCDNYASCLWDTKLYETLDPRADDSQPFYCAMYSFCPDPCCPEKRINKPAECIYNFDNPCRRTGSENKTCTWDRSLNTDLEAITLNHWNISCHCEEEGMRWESRFGLCVDIDECEENIDGCDNMTETCLNLRGTYGCGCSFGYVWNSKEEKCSAIEKLMLGINEEDFLLRPTEKNHTWKDRLFAKLKKENQSTTLSIENIEQTESNNPKKTTIVTTEEETTEVEDVQGTVTTFRSEPNKTTSTVRTGETVIPTVVRTSATTTKKYKNK